MPKDYKIGLALGMAITVAAAFFLATCPAFSLNTMADLDRVVVEKPQRFHIVGRNETLFGICEKYYDSPSNWQKILDANPTLKNPNMIKPGMKLIIPD